MPAAAPKSVAPPAPATRLWAGLAAVTAALLILTAMHVAMQRRVAAQTERFNVFPQPDKLLGVAVARQVFREPDLLPVYGSSELTQPQWNRADEFFGNHPSGFGAFLIGNPGETSLMIATKLAALGPETVGKKVVVFLSPGWFLVPELDHPGFGVNFSPLHAGIFAFESRLSAPLKQGIAWRLLDYPEIIRQSPLLDNALHDLAENTPAAYRRLALCAPLGALYDRTLRESDYGKLAYWCWQTARRSRRMEPSEPDDPVPPPQTVPINWQARIHQEDLTYRRQRPLTSYSTGPRTGFDDYGRQLFRDPQHPEVSPDENFARDCAASKEWTDLRLLLRVAQERNMRVLLVCQPINVKFSELQGLTERSSTLVYERMKEVAATYGAQLDLFTDGANDPHFFRDCIHPSAKAWVIYDHRLDSFYHESGPVGGL